MFVLSALASVLMALWNFITMLHSYCTQRLHQKGNPRQRQLTVIPRHLPYMFITRIEDTTRPHDVEDSILFGLGGDIDLPNQKVTYKSSMATKRFRRGSPIHRS
jgi:hypothetical protein